MGNLGLGYEIREHVILVFIETYVLLLLITNFRLDIQIFVMLNFKSNTYEIFYYKFV